SFAQAARNNVAARDANRCRSYMAISSCPRRHEGRAMISARPRADPAAYEYLRTSGPRLKNQVEGGLRRAAEVLEAGTGDDRANASFAGLCTESEANLLRQR